MRIIKNQEIITGKIKTNEHIFQLLDLQKKNLKKNISKDEMASQGFATVEHNFEKLSAMNNALPQIIALQNENLVGYALSMPVSFKAVIPELIPMFELLDNLYFENKPLKTYKYYVMGQICIDKSVRGMGVFQQLYAEHAKVFSGKFDFIVTEVSLSNKRSLRAHEKVGFKTIHEYYDPENKDDWAVVIWDFSPITPDEGI